MGHLYHKPHPHEPAVEGAASVVEITQQVKRYGTRWIADLSRLFGEYPWLYYVAYGSLGGSWGLGAYLIMQVGLRPATVVGGLLLVFGGFVEIVLSRALADARSSCPWWLRWWEEGYWGAMVDYGPGTFRFIGSAAAGLGCGVIIWSLLPRPAAVAVVTGVVACLGVWIWTWFAFDAMED
ncbi:MAG: hypothetical protein WCP21_06120 [Armatimonadota bacterium]